MRVRVFAIVLVTAVLVGFALLIPQLMTISEVRRTTAEANAGYAAEIKSLEKTNRSLAARLDELDERPETDAERAEHELELRRKTRMEAINQLITVLDGQSKSSYSRALRLLDSSFNVAVLKQFRELTPELKAALDAATMPAYTVTYACYFNWPDELPAGFAELFALDANQLKTLNDRVAATRKDVEAAILAATSVVQSGPARLVLTSTPLPPSVAAKYRDEFISVFRETLGDDGYAAFARLNGAHEAAPNLTTFFSGPQDFFDSFGQYGHTLTIEKRPDGRMDVLFDWKTFDHSTVRYDNLPTGTTNAPPEIARAMLGFLTKFIPTDF